MPTPYTLTKLKEIVAPVARRHGVKKVSIFGSYGRGQATEKSDVDLYIEKGRMKTLLHIAAFQLDMEEALKVHVDVVTNDIDDKAFLERIKPDEVTLYELDK